MNNPVIKWALLVFSLLVVLFSCMEYIRQCRLTERMADARRFVMEQRQCRTQEALLYAPSRTIELTDSQLKDLVDLYWNMPRWGAAIKTRSVKIAFESVCSLKLKKGIIEKYKEKYAVFSGGPLQRDPCAPYPKNPDPFTFSLDLRGINDREIVIKYSDGRNYENDLFRWNGTMWEKRLLSAGSATSFSAYCLDQAKT